MTVYLTQDELADGIGSAATQRVLTALGGSRFYVPGEARADSPIIEKLGWADADKLIRYMRTGHGGMSVEFPIATKAQRRTMMLAACADMSKSEPQLARELGVHVRTVRRWRSKARMSSPSQAQPGHLSGARILKI